MSNSFDEYINSQLAIQDDNNRELAQTKVRLGESALIFAVNVLEAIGTINSKTARVIRTGGHRKYGQIIWMVLKIPLLSSMLWGHGLIK